MRRRLPAALLVVAAATTGIPAPAVADSWQPAVVSADPVGYTPHVLDGTVWAMAVVGRTVVVGGDFKAVADSSRRHTYARRNIFAFDLFTGAVRPFAPAVDGGVHSLAAGPGATVYAGGSFLTIYLAPYNYHRIHAPLGGQITGYINVPGTLWPVNAVGVRNVDRLFCVNERLTTFLDTARGPCAVVAVGAMNVGRIRAVYDDVVTNVRRTRAVERKMYEKPIPVEKGGELGIFEMGSTVVIVFAPGTKLSPALQVGMAIRLGAPLEETAS